MRWAETLFQIARPYKRKAAWLNRNDGTSATRGASWRKRKEPWSRYKIARENNKRANAAKGKLKDSFHTFSASWQEIRRTKDILKARAILSREININNDVIFLKGVLIISHKCLRNKLLHGAFNQVYIRYRSRSIHQQSVRRILFAKKNLPLRWDIFKITFFFLQD